MNIIAKGKYSKHIARFGKLLHLENLQIQYEEHYTDLQDYYKIVSDIVKKETKFNIQPLIFEYLELKNPNLITDNILDCTDLNNSEDEFLTMISPILNITEPFLIENSISHLIKRNIKEREIIYHDKNNQKKHINAFTWICILNLCDEAKDKSYRLLFNDATKLLPKSEQRIAVIFCGFLRNYQYTTHLPILTSPIIDIFIHTWDDHGYKNDRRLVDKSWLNNNSNPINKELLITQYKPVKFLIENNQSMLDQFSLKTKINPIFLYSGQAKDDASKYINSQLYSIYSAYKLVCEHEKEKQIQYSAILRLRFDFKITHFDWSGIFEDIKTNCIYFPHASCNCHRHPGGGGGCLSCDRDITHDKHTNDICDIWFYGRRDVVTKACELYLNAEDILKINHEQNMNHLKTDKYSIKNGFVYISNTKDIENKYVSFYPEKLLREGLTGISCKSSRCLCGKI
jgi:hypothetical protein